MPKTPLARPGCRALCLLAAALLLTSCAYYNTFYLARRNYDRSLYDTPYPVDKSDVVPSPQFPKAIEYSRKVIDNYPKSKWVDDAYLLWARSLIANDDPRQAIKMLEEFSTRFPTSPQRDAAEFYLGVAARQARKYDRALRALDQFLARAPRHALVAYAQLERARTLMSLERPAEAAAAATLILEHHRKSPILARARVARAEAFFAQKEYDRAREDFRFLGTRAATDDERLTYLLREAECLEGAQQFDAALALLKNAIGHERAPVRSDTTGGRAAAVMQTPGYDRYGRLLTRIGTVHLRAGRAEDAVAAYRRVVEDYPRTPLGTEAQYRIGYAYETALDDFDRAHEEYGRVREQGSTTAFGEQASQRAASLERLKQFRQSGGDSLERKAEAAFLLAEQYLFELNKPDRALEEYRKIEAGFAGTPYAAKAIIAQGWTLSRRLERPAGADSLFWKVVHEHAGTEAQLAARDYLEFEGVEVPSELIKLPEPQLARADTTPVLAQPPEGPERLGSPAVAGAPVGDSLRLGPRRLPLAQPPGLRPPSTPAGGPVAGPPATTPGGAPRLPAPSASARPDTTLGGMPVPPDTTGGSLPARPDTARAGASARPGGAPVPPPAPTAPIPSASPPATSPAPADTARDSG